LVVGRIGPDALSSCRVANKDEAHISVRVAGSMSKKPFEAGAEESALIARAKDDQEAFGQLYERYSQRIYQYIYYRTSSEADAEDLTARTFMRAWQHMATYDDRGVPFSAWLYRIAHNLVANWHRDRSRRKIISLEDLSRWQVNEDGPEAVALFAEDRAALLRAIRRLPSDRQELLALKFVEHLSNAEIGAVMGRSEGAVKSLYHRTLMTLREELQEEMPAEPKGWPLRRLLGRFGDK
jgi:RNA polymerase sigma-70 factor (ECF subfamily)